MSDILLASRLEFNKTAGTSITRKGISLLPNPTRIFSKDQELYLYVEVYHLVRNENGFTDFEQSITLRQDDDARKKSVVQSILNIFKPGKKDEKISITGRNQTQGKNSAVYLKIDMGSYQAGDYILTLTIKDFLSEQQVSGETTIYWR